MWKEFRPALLFLAKFLGIYLGANILYGVFVESYQNKPDPITIIVSKQTASCVRALNYNASTEINSARPTVILKNGQLNVLNVFEGCNGINVMIVFIAFIFAFGGFWKTMAWFIPIGLVIIHIFNLLRISFLFYLSETNARSFYYYHKYWFTAVLYLVVFALWALWIKKTGNRLSKTSSARGEKN